MFALIDCNNFYASCERVFNPALNGKAVVVLSNNDGCVIARSNEAKEAGIPMGAPMFQYAQLIKEKNIKVFSANFELYGDMSHRVMTMLNDYCSNIEIYSIDEAFLKYENHEQINLQEYALGMQRQITKCTGIPISVGFAHTKALSKLANRIAKKYANTTANVYVIDNEEKRIKALKWLKIEDVWGIGRQHSKKLKEIGINTAYDFTQMSDNWVRSKMSVVGLRLKHELQGIATLDLEEISTQKNISTTRSFERNCNSLEVLQERIASFAIACAEKLRKQQSCCNALMVFVSSNRHRKDLLQYNRSIIIKLPYPTNSSIEISKFAIKALQQIHKAGVEYKRAGVILTDFTPEAEKQLDFFENSNPRHQPLMKAMDKLNRQFGRQTIKLASQDIRRESNTNQKMISPKYSTRLNDIIKIKV